MHKKKIAITFPGQSSQHIGMLSSLATHFKIIKETFSEVSESLGYDMWNLIQYGPSSKLNETCYAQPAILTASVAIWRVWQMQGGPIPDIMAGHSLGEYSALVCSDSMDLLSAAQLVKTRGILMQKSVPNGVGSMSIIIGLNNDIVIELCQMIESKYKQIVSPACFNACDNIVIAGHKEAVNKVSVLCRTIGAKYVSQLPISVPSHCVLMKSMIDEFTKELSKITIQAPRIPVLNNTDVCIENKPECIRNALIRQLYTAVRWNEIIQKLITKKVKKFLEFGPGKVLTRLIKNTDNHDIYSISVNDLHSLSESIQICKN